MLAHNAVLHCPRFKRFFDELCARAKRYKVAMTACMRKLLVTLNQMVKTNTHWNQQLKPDDPLKKNTAAGLSNPAPLGLNGDFVAERSPERIRLMPFTRLPWE